MNLMPTCMDDMISPDSEVRAIDAIVDKMDIPSIGFTYSAMKEIGRKPYNPIDMFKPHAYSYFNIIPIVTKADNSFMAATKEYGKVEFRYDAAQDEYICPQGHLLRAYHHREEYTQETDIKRYQNFEACSNCPVREKCSTVKRAEPPPYPSRRANRPSAGVSPKQSLKPEEPALPALRASGFVCFSPRGLG